MSRRLLVLLVLICALALAPAASFAWKFVSIADSRGSNNGVNTAELTTIINLVKAENPDLVIFEGDAVNGCDDVCMSSQFDTWLPIMNTLNCPWYFTPGNHEITTSTGQVNVVRAKLSMPLNGPAGDEEMVYSFDHENAHFVALNSDHYGQAGHVQRSWLSTDLASTTKPHIFVFAHEPAYPSGPHIGTSLDVAPAERDDFWNIMTNAGVRMYFCGHEHLYQRSLHGVIYQVLNGSCGAPLHTGYANTIAQYHYTVITVDGNNVHGDTRNDTGALLDSWDFVAEQPTASNCDSAKFLSDGAYITLTGEIVTCVRGSDIYVQEDDRSSAFKIAGVSGISVKDKVNVRGWLQTNPVTGEREITGAVIKVSSGNDLPKPLGMANKSLLGGTRGSTLGAAGGVGCNTSSLLVRAYGKVSSIGSGANSGMFYLDDGSGLSDGTTWNGKPNVGVRVLWGGSVAQDETKIVTGIASAFINGSSVQRLLYCTDKITLGSWTAYNDVVYSSGHPALKPNVTTYSIGSGSPGPASGMLKDFTTGTDTGVTVALSQSGGVVWQPASGSGGIDCNSGTDAYNTFNPNTASLYGVVYYGATGWVVDAAFTGLDPAKTYEFATSANRNDATYTDRFTKYTISGVDAFTNASTPGVTVGSGGAAITFNTGYNTINGYVARWTNIRPGADGSFSVRAEAATTQYKAYAFSAFVLKQLP